MSDENSSVSSAGKLAESKELSMSRDSLSTISEGSADLEAALAELNGETLDSVQDPSVDVLSLSSQDSLAEEKKPHAPRGRGQLKRAATVPSVDASAVAGHGKGKSAPRAANGTAGKATGIPKRPPMTKSKSGDAGPTSHATEKSATSGGEKAAAPAVHIKETRASIARKQKLASAQSAEPEPDHDYLTPLQKKEQLMKEQRRELRDTHYRLEQRDAELRDIVSMKDSEIGFLMNEKETEIQELGDSLRCALDEKATLNRKYEEAVGMLSECEKTIKEMETDRVRREAMHEEMYYKMYLKGQKSADFERQDELAKAAEDDPSTVSITELLTKLNTTQEELTKWQTLKREELYAKAEKPETEADCMLRFLRDSMFHYLTVREDKDQAQHLRAMVGILGFTQVQLRKITKAKDENKKK